MKKLKLKTENTKAYKLGYTTMWHKPNPYEGSSDSVDALRFEQGRHQRKQESKEHERA